MAGKNKKEEAEEEKMITQLILGFILGVFIDFLIDGFQVATGYYFKQQFGLSPIPFFYYKQPITTLAWADVIMLVSNIFVFLKNRWLAVGYFLGWYIASNEAWFWLLIESEQEEVNV